MASRSLTALTPRCLSLYYKFEEEMNRLGIKFIITCTARLVKEQVALYAQGRQSLDEVNRLRKIVNLAPISAKENRRRVTWTLNSKHLIDLDDSDPYNDYARAFDIVIMSPDKKITWDLKADVNKDGLFDYQQAAEVGLKVGLVPGFYFKNCDPCHFEEPQEERSET